MRKPSLKSPCPADRYSELGERRAEFSFPGAASGTGDLPGGLILFKDRGPDLSPLVEIYRHEGCEIRVAHDAPVIELLDVPGPGDVPNAHGVSWIAHWSRGGASASEPCRGFIYARAWLAEAARRHGNKLPEYAIPLAPDGLAGWKYEIENRGRYGIRQTS